MALYNNSLTHYYDYVFTDLADPRTNDWFLISSPMPGLTLLGAYLYFVLSAGPRYMRHRKPFELTNVLIFYNFVQVLISTWIFWEGLDGAWLRHYSWRCEPVDFSNSPQAIRVARGVYIYFLAKLTELLDTVFFVLRKKDRQITFLHMYHHTVMPMVSWGATKYYPGGHGTFIGVINSFVHIIMYFYYMMAAMGPQFQKYLWWKKYITTLQMGQFCLAFLHSFQLVFYDCGYPRWSVFLTLPNAIFFYYLFNDFYGKAYSSYNKNQSGEEKSISNGKVVEEKQDSHNKEKEA
ncbi:elongation of very long chain fatty acids protein AAEL008004 [Schistocerca gregaria]|uniref:elongation of very long chain fatty acids protein AAEL008004 n=1 Tax=Schistocerca gregaria TaxID=7010 RepID=UPI00211ECE4E|nr:elongation of very long chain fatty acids protein AAEL008004 [Schistocerca gregaria]